MTTGNKMEKTGHNGRMTIATRPMGFATGWLREIALIMAFLATALIGAAPRVEAGAYYGAMVDEINGFFRQALQSYRDGDKTTAKKKANAAYFEVFENLEGPIRINFSARDSFKLEEEFVSIRKMIVADEPADKVEARVNALMADLNVVAASLQSGHKKDDAGGDTKGVDVNPAWLPTMETISAVLHQALNAYGDDRIEEAQQLVKQALFTGYKNSLLETAVRRHISQARDQRHNSAFRTLVRKMHDHEPDFVLELEVRELLEAIRTDLNGLALVDGVEPMAPKKEKAPDKDWAAVSASLFSAIDTSIGIYAKGNVNGARTMVQDAYFDIFEASGMEARIGAGNAEKKAELEGFFSLLVAKMKKGAPAAELRDTAMAMQQAFTGVVNDLGSGNESPTALFIYSLLIILREGFEAILIISAILAYLIKTGHKDKVKTIYNGCLAALFLSAVTAVLVKWVFQVESASQELLEGATMLVAAAVLFSVSFWLLGKAQARKWSAYLRDKVTESLSASSLSALWLTAFLAVYREGAETVLFYQALAVSSAGPVGMTAIGGGFFLGCLLLVALALAMRFGAVRLPIKPFFIISGALMYVMAFVFAGNGIMELIEGKLIDPGLVSWAPTIPLLGIFPYWQSMSLQGMLVLAAAGALLVFARRKTATA